MYNKKRKLLFSELVTGLPLIPVPERVPVVGNFWSKPTLTKIAFQVELEKLNSSTDVINKLEIDLEVIKKIMKKGIQ